MSETAYELGAVLGTAVLGSVLAAAYRGGVVVPTSIGPAHADASRETLGGAVGAAGRVPGVDGQALLASARSAFDAGMEITAAVGASVLVAVAVAVVVGLRPVQRCRA